MKAIIKDYFKEIEPLLSISSHEIVNLHIIGSAAIMLQTDYARGTKDTDIIDLMDENMSILSKLKKIAGKGTPLAKKYRTYIDIVKRGVPLMPQSPIYHALEEINCELKNITLYVLDLHDVVVNKLKPFRAQDVEDIEAVVNRGLIDPEKLRKRFESAKEICLLGARAAYLRGYIENLNTVERDILSVNESDIELPHWLTQ